eukprot:scpid110495/ scgid3738/ 
MADGLVASGHKMKLKCPSRISFHHLIAGSVIRSHRYIEQDIFSKGFGICAARHKWIPGNLEILTAIHMNAWENGATECAESTEYRQYRVGRHSTQKQTPCIKLGCCWCRD